MVAFRHWLHTKVEGQFGIHKNLSQNPVNQPSKQANKSYQGAEKTQLSILAPVSERGREISRNVSSVARRPASATVHLFSGTTDYSDPALTRAAPGLCLRLGAMPRFPSRIQMGEFVP